MRKPRSLSPCHLIAVAAVLVTLLTVRSGIAYAQGCAPSRFTSPAVTPLGDVYMGRGTWQVGVAYRELNSNQYIVGHAVRNDLTPRGLPSVVKSQTIYTSIAYAVTDRLGLTLNVPFSHGTHETWYADSARHQNSAAGVGEISLLASYWLRRAQALQPGGNVAVGLGVKAPTGKNDVEGKWWKADGSSVAFPVHQSIELGDGGWGFIANARGFRPVKERSYAYAGASYTLNPKKQSDVVKAPGSTVHWSVPDTWEADAGLSTLVSVDKGISLNVAGVFNGTPKRDVIGRDDNAWRLPATAGYLSTGITIARGAQTFTFNVPVRMYMNFQTNVLDEVAGKLTGGGLSKMMILGGYSVRF
jgi:hypothetical protein